MTEADKFETKFQEIINNKEDPKVLEAFLNETKDSCEQHILELGDPELSPASHFLFSDGTLCTVGMHKKHGLMCIQGFWLGVKQDEEEKKEQNAPSPDTLQ